MDKWHESDDLSISDICDMAHGIDPYQDKTDDEDILENLAQRIDDRDNWGSWDVP